MDAQISETIQHFLPLLIVIALFELVMKLIAMWRAGRNNNLAWFIVIGIINTAGILPIIYLLINRKKKPEEN
ncbi:MAG: hypothetical protein J7K64_00050 [Bacteroidales bacterium]|nr:hypothetical protein [Bacteroidales bacterium]